MSEKQEPTQQAGKTKKFGKGERRYRIILRRPRNGIQRKMRASQRRYAEYCSECSLSSSSLGYYKALELDVAAPIFRFIR
jgi:hypothetical protein